MKKLGEHLAIICIFILLFIIFTYPLIANLGEALIGPPGESDQLFNLWTISWDNHIIARNPLNLFQANVNYPSTDSLTFSEPLLSIALAAAPIRLLTSNPVAGYNILLVLGFSLCGYTLYLLVKYLTGNRPAAFVAGVLYAFLPYHFSILSRPQESFYFLLPLLLLLLFRYFENRRISYLLGWATILLIQGLTSPTQAAIFLLPAGLFLVWQISAANRRDRLKPIIYTLFAILICMLLLLPFFLPYLRLEGNKPEEELDPPTEVRNAAKPRYYFTVLEQNLVYGGLGFKQREIGEGVSLFPGFLGLLLGIAGIWFTLFKSKRKEAPELEKSRGNSSWGSASDALNRNEEGQEREKSRGNSSWGSASDALNRNGEGREAERSRRARGFAVYFLVIGLSSFILCLGPRPRGYYNFIYRAIHYLTPYRLISSPLRYHVLVVLSLSVLAGYGGAFLHRTLEKRWKPLHANLALMLISLILIVELLTVHIPLVRVPTSSAIPLVYRDLSTMEDLVLVEAPVPFPGQCYIFEDPLRIQPEEEEERRVSFRERETAYLSTYHWKRTVNGWGDYHPVFYRRFILEMQAFPSSRTLKFLQGAGVDYVLLRRSQIPVHSREYFYNNLAKFEGLHLERCYPDGLSLYRFDRVEPATFEQLEMNFFCPSRAEPGVKFSAGLVYINQTGRPLVNLVENKQYINIYWIGESGEKVKGEKVSFFLPVMIDSGEGAISHLELNPPSKEGDYRLLVEATEGPLAGSFGGGNIILAYPPAEQEERVTKGSLKYLGETEQVLSLYPSEPFSLMVKAENQGNYNWRRTISKLAESVVVKATLQRHGPWEHREEQLGLLPSDIAPGQAIQFPICLQAPPIEGEYTLRLALSSSENGSFGKEIKIRVKVTTQ